jgi:hypothetical protein
VYFQNSVYVSIWIYYVHIYIIRPIRQNPIFKYKETRTHWLAQGVHCADAITSVEEKLSVEPRVHCISIRFNRIKLSSLMSS